MAFYAFLIEFQKVPSFHQVGETEEANKIFVDNFFKAYHWISHEGFPNLYVPQTYYDNEVAQGLDPIIKIAGRIPDSVMNKIKSIKLIRVTDFEDVTKTIGINPIRR